MMELAITKNSAELEQLEGVIERGLSTFYEVGRALMRIRDEQLYEKVRGIATFESYCSERWGMSRMHAHRLIDSCMVVDNVTDRLQKHPAINLEQTRPLARLEPAQQREAWQKAVETAPEGKVTAAHVSKVVKELTGENTHTQSSPEEDSDAIFHLKRWWKKATKKDKQMFLLWKELTGEQPKPYVLKHEPIIKQELVSEAFQLAYDAIVIELKNARATKWRDTSYKGALEMMKTLVTITEQMGR